MEIRVFTESLCVPKLTEMREFRLSLITQLIANGLSCKQVAESLNKQGIRTLTGKTYTQKLEWGTNKKYQDRKRRLKTWSWEILDVYPVKVLRW